MRLSTVLAAVAASTALAGPAAAFDCAAAKSDIDKAICGSPDLKAADDAMSGAYKAAHDGAAPADRGALLASQRAWNKRRGGGCDSGDARYVACMIDDTNARIAFLEGRAEGGSGASPMRPAFLMRAGKRGGLFAADVELLKFADPKTPGEKTFNAEVAKIIAGVPKTSEGLSADQMGSYSLALRVVWASPKLISARLDGLVDGGGAYPNSASWGVNIDAASGKKLAFADGFDAAAHEKLDADCLAQIVAQKKRRAGDAPADDDLKTLRANVDKGLGDLAGWSLSAKGATVTFVGDPVTGDHRYDIGVHVEGDYACELPLARVKALAKAGFPLPE